jgi:hypothetical protein
VIVKQSPTVEKSAAVTQDRQDVVDQLAYAAGRVEGAAWRERGRNLADELRRARLPYPVS